MSKKDVFDQLGEINRYEDEALEGATRRAGVTALLGIACAGLVTQAGFISQELHDKVPAWAFDMAGAGVGALAVLTAIGAVREGFRAFSHALRGAAVSMVIADRMYDEKSEASGQGGEARTGQRQTAR